MLRDLATAPLVLGLGTLELVAVLVAIVVGIAVVSKVTAIATKIAIRLIIIVVAIAGVLWLLGQLGLVSGVL